MGNRGLAAAGTWQGQGQLLPTALACYREAMQAPNCPLSVFRDPQEGGLRGKSPGFLGVRSWHSQSCCAGRRPPAACRCPWPTHLRREDGSRHLPQSRGPSAGCACLGPGCVTADGCVPHVRRVRWLELRAASVTISRSSAGAERTGSFLDEGHRTSPV